MLGFFPLGAYELENPTFVEFKENAYILGAVTLAGLALSGGKPPTTAAELEAALAVEVSATAPRLHFDAALQASPTALSLLSDAALLRAPTLRAATAAATDVQASRLLLPTPRVAASASASLDAGAVYTIPLPHTLAAAPEASFAVASIYTVQLPRALAAGASATTSAAANITPTPNFAASGVVDLALGQANLRRSALFDANPSLDVSGSGYLNRAPHMHSSDGSIAFSGSVQKINLERWLAAAPSASVVSFGTLGVPATLWAAASAATTVAANAVILEHEFPAPERKFTTSDFSVVRPLVPGNVRYEPRSMPVVSQVGDVQVTTSEAYIIELVADSTPAPVITPALVIVAEALSDEVTEIV